MTSEQSSADSVERPCSDIERMLNENPFPALRAKWGAVPAGKSRFATAELLKLPDEPLIAAWMQNREGATTGKGFGVRGWYHTIYKDVFRGKRVLDVGAGLGIDGVTFAQHGAKMTFLDIVESNLELLERICRILKVENVAFHYLEDLSSLSSLPESFDVIWCQGSLINMPFDVTRREAQALLEHLPVGGRWVELAYPEERWRREGGLPFERWGDKTDGGAPWMEWYDLAKLKKLLAPAEFEVVLSFNFSNNDFNWFDLIRTA
jgi:SAM-dependent methyltransferase